MTVQFQQATRTQARLRMALIGPSGSGKTYSALAIGTVLGKKVAVIDTEHGSASKYAGDPYKFDVLELTSYHPERYVEAIHAAEAAGYDVLVIDSLSHAWVGKDGSLELKDRASARPGESSFTAWRHVTPLHNQLIDTILGARLHVIATMRAKTEYVIEQGGRPKKIGLAPVMRDGIEYEFDVTGDLTIDHELVISKTRAAVLDGKVFKNPGAQVAELLTAWLSEGTPIEYADEKTAKKIDELFTELYGANGGEVPAREFMESEYGTRDTTRLTVTQAKELLARLGKVKKEAAA